jgi:hypothetical protein
MAAEQDAAEGERPAAEAQPAAAGARPAVPGGGAGAGGRPGRYLWLPVAGPKRERRALQRRLPAALAFVRAHLAAGRRVLVHCDDGARLCAAAPGAPRVDALAWKGRRAGERARAALSTRCQLNSAPRARCGPRCKHLCRKRAHEQACRARATRRARHPASPSAAQLALQQCLFWEGCAMRVGH